MPWYNDLRPTSDTFKQRYGLIFPTMTDPERKRTIQNLLTLREALTADIAPKTTDHNLLIATWNLKEFGHRAKRLPETYFYIAEILNRFDLIAIQEVKRTLDDLHIVMRLLGRHWSYLVADITEGSDGNSERFSYIYDERRVSPSGLAGEIVLWDDLTFGSSVKQLKRTPYITGFKAGWKSFAIINVHLQPGDDTDDTKRRKEEVRLLMAALKEKLDKKRLWTRNLMLMGDFNLYQDDDDIVALIGAEGFDELDDLAGVVTNVFQTEIYDRSFFCENAFFQVASDGPGPDGAVFQMFDHVFTDAQVAGYTAVS